VGGREGEDLEGFRDVFLEPTGKARGGLVVADDRGLESPIGFGTVVGVVAASDVVGDFAPHAAFVEALEERPPMSLSLAACDTAAENGPLAVGGDADGGEHRTRHDGSAMPELFVSGVEDQIDDLAEGPVPTCGQLFVEFGGSSADLGGGDLEAAELLHDLRDLPGADDLDVHLGDRQGHGPLAAYAPVEALGVEGPPLFVVVVAGLRDPQLHLAQTSTEGLRLESVRGALTVGRSLMRLGLESLITLILHGTVHDDGIGRGDARRAMLDQDRRDGFKDSIFFLVGHRRFLLGGVKYFQENLDDPPFQIGDR